MINIFLDKTIIIIALFISYVLQYGADFFVLGNISPDFLLILTTYFALYRGEFSGLWIGFIAGLLQDINLGGYSLFFNEVEYYVGTHALGGALVGYLFGKFSTRVKEDNSFMIFISIFILSLVKGFIVFILVIIFHRNIDTSNFVSIVITETVYTSMIGIFWFKFLKKIFPIKQKYQNLTTTKKYL